MLVVELLLALAKNGDQLIRLDVVADVVHSFHFLANVLRIDHQS